MREAYKQYSILDGHYIGIAYLSYYKGGYCVKSHSTNGYGQSTEYYTTEDIRYFLGKGILVKHKNKNQKVFQLKRAFSR